MASVTAFSRPSRFRRNRLRWMIGYFSVSSLRYFACSSELRFAPPSPSNFGSGTPSSKNSEDTQSSECDVATDLVASCFNCHKCVESIFCAVELRCETAFVTYSCAEPRSWRTFLRLWKHSAPRMASLNVAAPIGRIMNSWKAIGASGRTTVVVHHRHG